MAAQGFLLIASFLLILFILAKPLSAGLTRFINNTPLPATAGVERLLWRALGISMHEMNWLQYLLAILALNVLGLAVLFVMLLCQNVLPLNPQQLPGLSASGAQHGGQLCCQHQLAVLQRGNHRKLLQPDGRPCRTKLLVCRHRYCRRVCADPRFYAPEYEHAR